MSNKKKESNNKKDIKKGTMSKTDKRKLEKELEAEKKKIYSVDASEGSVKSKIITIVVIIIIFVVFYLLTVLITKNSSSDTTTLTNTSKVTSEDISYDDIVIGRSFNMDDGEYLVLYYDKSNDDLSNNISSILTTYNNKDSHLKVYSVDMSSPFNSSYTSGESNQDPKSVDDLKINGPTLIKFSNGEAVDYIEGEDNIKDYLS